MSIEELRKLKNEISQEYYVIDLGNPSKNAITNEQKMNIAELNCTSDDTKDFVTQGVEMLEHLLVSNQQISDMRFQVSLSLLADEQLSPFTLGEMHFIDDIALVQFTVYTQDKTSDNSWQKHSLTGTFGDTAQDGVRPVQYKVFVQELIKQGYDFGLPLTLTELIQQFIDKCQNTSLSDVRFDKLVRFIQTGEESSHYDFNFDFYSIDLSSFAPSIKIDVKSPKEKVK